jgi:hypothetical protein
MERRALDITRSAASVHAGHQGPADHTGQPLQLVVYKQSRLHQRGRSHTQVSPKRTQHYHNIVSSRLSALRDERPRVGRTWQQASDARPPERSSALSPPQVAGPCLGLDRPPISARHSPSGPHTLVPTSQTLSSLSPLCPHFPTPAYPPGAAPCCGRGTHTL